MSKNKNKNDNLDKEEKQLPTEEAAAEEASAKESDPAEKSLKKSSPGSAKGKTAGKGKRLKHGALSVTFTVIFVAAIILINIIFNMVLDRFDLSVDLTDKSYYSIDDSTTEYLAEVDDNITIIITANENDFENAYEYYKQASEIAKRFASANSKFTLEYKDLDENPSFYSKYGETLSAGSIIVESAETGRYVVITSSDYLSPKYYFNGEEISYTEWYYYYQLGYSSYLATEYYAATEKCLLSAIMNVTNDNPVRVAFLLGYGVTEAPSVLSSLLESNAYTVETLNIETTDKIDSDIDFVVIYAPIYDYTNDSLNVIDMWLDNGGKYGKNLLYAASYAMDELPNLNAYLEEWGISVGSGFVYQTNSDYGYETSPTYQVLNPEDTDYADGVDTTTKNTYGDRMKPITLLFDEYSNYTTETIVSSYSGAVISPFDSSDWDSSQAEESGEFAVAAVSEKVYYEGVDPYYSRVYVVSGQYFLDDYFLSSTAANNSDIALNIFRIASGKDDFDISITVEAFGYDTFELTSSQAQAITVILAVVIPVAVIAAGVVIIIRRKRR